MEINFSANNFEKFSGFLTKDNIVLVKVRPGFDEELRFSAMDVELLSVERGNEELRLALRRKTSPRPPLAHFVRSSRDTPVVHRSSWRPVAPARPSTGPRVQRQHRERRGDLRTEFGRNVIKA